MSASSAARTAVRTVQRLEIAPSQKEGAGFIVQRPFPGSLFSDEETDPFLMLDEIGPIPLKAGSPGAPWHPHRGFDTVSYIKAGYSAHQDSLGNKGTMKAGEVQWMHTGSGIIHDEGQPKGITQEELTRDHGDTAHAYQLWINNPPHLKMTPPSYTHLTAETFAWAPWGDNAEIKLFAGTFGSSGAAASAKSPLDLPAPALFADVKIREGVAEFPIESSMNTCIVYVYAGEGKVFSGGEDSTGKAVKRLSSILFTPPSSEQQKDTGHTSSIKFESTNKDTDVGLQMIVMAGEKIGAPIARYGPFVMNTQAELRQAFSDYRNGNFVRDKATKMEL